MRYVDSEKINLKDTPSGEQVSILVGRHDSTGASKNHTVAYVKLVAGNSSDPHYHKEREESYYFVKGNGKAIIDGHTVNIKPGDLIFTKPNETHKFIANANSELEYLVITSPCWVPSDSFAK